MDYTVGICAPLEHGGKLRRLDLGGLTGGLHQRPVEFRVLVLGHIAGAGRGAVNARGKDLNGVPLGGFCDAGIRGNSNTRLNGSAGECSSRDGNRKPVVCINFIDLRTFVLPPLKFC